MLEELHRVLVHTILGVVHFMVVITLWMKKMMF
jgi:hypothetical protein